MVNRFKDFGKIALIFTASIAFAGCSASSHNMTYQDADSLLSGYSNTTYRYGYDSGHSNYGADYNSGYADVNMTSGVSSRYGYSESGLRSACDIDVQSCGFMRVVPVYPVYQVVTAPPVVETPPPVTLTEAEPPVIVLPPEPAPEPPVYTPPPVQEFWPEPATPIKRWTPPRK